MKDNKGVHESHCCIRHGCKYGEEDCPVVSGEIKQLYDCEACGFDEEDYDIYKELEELRLYKREHERLKKELNKILHPNNDGPKNPSFCDIVAYVRGDLRKLKKEIEELKDSNDYLSVQLETEDI